MDWRRCFETHLQIFKTHGYNFTTGLENVRLKKIKSALSWSQECGRFWLGDYQNKMYYSLQLIIKDDINNIKI